MPGAEERDLGGEGAVHVSVAGLGGGCVVHVGVGQGQGAGGDLGRRKYSRNLGGSDRTSIRSPSQGPGMGRAPRAARRDDCVL